MFKDANIFVNVVMDLVRKGEFTLEEAEHESVGIVFGVKYWIIILNLLLINNLIGL